MSKWKCADCGSPEVVQSLPCWTPCNDEYNEYDPSLEDIDWESETLSYHCLNCDSGEKPVRSDKACES